MKFVKIIIFTSVLFSVKTLFAEDEINFLLTGNPSLGEFKLDTAVTYETTPRFNAPADKSGFQLINRNFRSKSGTNNNELTVTFDFRKKYNINKIAFLFFRDKLPESLNVAVANTKDGPWQKLKQFDISSQSTLWKTMNCNHAQARYVRISLQKGKSDWILNEVKIYGSDIDCPQYYKNKGVIWFDGSYDSTGRIPGKLLSDNQDYWGDSILTGVDYQYDEQPDSPPEKRPDRQGKIGRTLLNGNRGRGVGMIRNKPLSVTFDFKRICTFNEWDIVTPSLRIAVELYVRNAESDQWKKVFEQSLKQSTTGLLHRIKLKQKTSGRFVKMTIQAKSRTKLNEVIAWGDSVIDSNKPENIVRTASGQYPVGVAFPTITGVGKSSISDRESFFWLKSLPKDLQKQPAVWFQVPTWDSISNKPLVPDSKLINSPIKILMARNESEAVALALKNTLIESNRKVTVKLQPITFKDGKATKEICLKLGVMGVIGDRGFGNNLVPIFEKGNMLGRSLMKKYLLNGPEIFSFPTLTLPPSGAAILWLKVTSNGAAPGVYRSAIQVEGGPPVPIEVEVLDVNLPSAFAHIKGYSCNYTNQFPFVYGKRMENDMKYAIECGLNDWGYILRKYRYSHRTISMLKQILKANDRKQFSELERLIPTPYVRAIHSKKWTEKADLPENALEIITEQIQSVVRLAKELHLNDSEWYGIIGDEPNDKNMKIVAYISEFIKKTAPNVLLYINPCFWKGYENDAVAPDKTISESLSGWYNKYVDVSMPVLLLLNNRPQSRKIFLAPRRVNSYYLVSAQLDRSESSKEIQKYRRMAWNSFRWGMNGWAFYSYYSPRGSAWNHFDRNPKGEGGGEASDYQMVYPGPAGVIMTRHSEALREGWEDWKLLNLLKQHGMDEFLATLINRYNHGEPLTLLRKSALKKAAQLKNGNN